MLPKPASIAHFENQLGSIVPLGPNALSTLKLVVVTPLLFLALRQVEILPVAPYAVVALFAAFSLLDYLDGLVARTQGKETPFGRVFDRITDYPLLMMVSWFCIDQIPIWLLAIKLALDLLLVILFWFGRGSSENRLRTGLSYTTLLALLFLSQGWLPRLIQPQTVTAVLWIGIGFSALVVLFNLRVLQKRFIADTLSGANLVCGIFSMLFASRGLPEVSLLFLLIGAAFDGFDGAAARRWGGTSWGVYSDDIADGVNYAIAPGFALWWTLGSVEGIAIGVAYSIFTLSRLVYFTLNKGNSDPGVFSGVPSTVGGIVVLCALILFTDNPALVGVFVGAACVQMVSFSAAYAHLGRAVGGQDKKRSLSIALFYIAVLVLGGQLFGIEGAVAIVLISNLLYGFGPTLVAFRKVLRLRREKKDIKP